MINKNNKGRFVKGHIFNVGRKMPHSEEFNINHSLKMKGKHCSPQTEFKKGHKGHLGYKNPNIWNKGLTKETDERVKKSAEIRAGKKRPKISGENNSHWRGGITPLRGKIQSTLEYKKWRSDIFQRDNWTCQTCRKRGYIEAHHIKEFAKILKENNIKNVEEAINCKELWDINNGVTLCKDCHILTKKGRLHKLYK